MLTKTSFQCYFVTSVNLFLHYIFITFFASIAAFSDNYSWFSAFDITSVLGNRHKEMLRYFVFDIVEECLGYIMYS